MNVVNIYRDNLLLYGIKPQDDSVHSKQIMGDNVVRLTFVEPQYIEFKIGDKAEIFGEWFYLSKPPIVSKIKVPGEEYRYEMTLDGTTHILSRIQFLFLGDDNSLKEGEFSLTGTAREFLDMIAANLQRLQPYFNFTVQQALDDGYRTLTFSSENCLEALKRIAEAFNTEYWIDGTEISLAKKQTDSLLEFKHGKRKGLYEIVRQNVDSENIVTRIYPFGSEKNLPADYRNYSKRLKLPEQPKSGITNLTWSIIDNGDGTQTYTFNFDPPSYFALLTTVIIYSRPVGSAASFMNPVSGPGNTARNYTTPTGDYEFVFETRLAGVPKGTTFPVAATSYTTQPALPLNGDVIYLEKNVNEYGLFEATKIFDEVYPHRTGTITGVNGSDPLEFTDSGIDFDVNDYLLPGLTAKVAFNSGQLSGYSFDIRSYDNSLKKFILNKNKDETNLDIPSVDFAPAIGDKYVLLDITLPQSYIDAAEAELMTKAQEYLDLMSQPQLSYRLIFDPVYLKEKMYSLYLGLLITIKDSELQVDKKIRIVSIQRNIVNEYQYTIEVSDIIRKPRLQVIQQGQTNIKNDLSSVKKAFEGASIINNRVRGSFFIENLPEYADNSAALAAGLTPAEMYRTGSVVKVVHA